MFRIKLVRESGPVLLARPQFEGPEDIAAVLFDYLEHADREHFVVVMLDAQNGLIGVHTASVGTLTAALVSPREVFKAAILANAASIVVAHNHPSGDPEPSPEDIHVTEVLRRAGTVLEVEVLDHIVVGDGGRFVSLKRRGHMG